MNHLLPADCGHQDWIHEVNALPHSVAHFSLFMGFEGDIEEAGATPLEPLAIPDWQSRRFVDRRA